MNSAYISFATATTNTSTINSTVYSSKAMDGQPQTVWSSRSFSRAVTTPQGSIDLLINKRKVINESPITPDLSKKRCKVTTPENQVTGRQSSQPSGSGQASIPLDFHNPAGSSGQSAKEKFDQRIDIGKRQYTRQEIADMSIIELNQLLRNEENVELTKCVTRIRRTEKNRGYSRERDVRKRVKLQEITDQIKTLQSDKTILESENNNLLQEIKTTREKCEDLKRLLSMNKY